MFAFIVWPIQSSSATFTYRLPYQSLLYKKNNKQLMAFKIVVLYPSFGESALVHFNSFGGFQSPYNDGENN